MQRTHGMQRVNCGAYTRASLVPAVISLLLLACLLLICAVLAMLSNNPRLDWAAADPAKVASYSLDPSARSLPGHLGAPAYVASLPSLPSVPFLPATNVLPAGFTPAPVYVPSWRAVTGANPSPAQVHPIELAALTDDCPPAWRVVPNPPPYQSTASDFIGLAAVSADDIWAVGSYSVYTVARTLIEHWDGLGWSQVPSPNVPGQETVLTAASAVSANDIWAVGHSPSNYRTITEHWDGNQWSLIPSPSMGTGDNLLLGVAAVAANDVWAVGSYADGSGYLRTLIERWNGASWNIIPSPNLSEFNNELRSVAALSSSDVWAVGYSHIGSADQTLTIHWDGTRWSPVPGPNAPGSTQDILYGVSAVSTDNVWAVGFDNSGDSLILHWDGDHWTQIPAPRVGAYHYLFGVSAAAANNVWAVGEYQVASGEVYSLALHWDGTSWTYVTTPSPGVTTQLWQVASISESDAWAVGDVQVGAYRTIVEHYTDPCETPVPSPTPSPGPSLTHTPTTSPTPISTVITTSTATPSVLPSGTPTSVHTPTSTTTPCSMSFTDVSQSDYFYQPVLYLYCRGVISGYSDKTFRPYNNTTRGQLTKIVVLGFGLSIYTPPTPSFNDVPTTNPFYQYIETAYHSSLVSGYDCGGPGEPCPGLYFRPGNNVTRGQLSKIVVLAAGWPLLDPPNATFGDVEVGSVFFRYVETAYSHSIISGYNCGNGCLEFRPGNNATRGQICKLVYQAITQP
jgi:hypothetical protein